MSFKNKIINVKAEKIVFPGRSLCRCEDGIALFSESLLPGETADVFVTRDKKTFREGFVKNITEKSPERIEPVCSSFGRCGGCTFQNTEYKNQIKYKQIYTEELLGVFGVKINKILESPEVWHYRNKMEFSFFSVYDADNNAVLSLGLHQRGSFNKYVSVPPCFIADKDFLKAAEIIKRFAIESGLPAYNNRTHEGFFRHLVLRKAVNANQLLINLVTNAADLKKEFFEPFVKELSEFAGSIYWTQNGRLSDAVVVDKIELLYGNPCITERLNVGGENYSFNVSPFSFFQTNSKGAEILYNEVLRLLNPSKNEELIDLYCGTGTIGISLSKNVKKVIGIEQVPQAIDDAKTNAALNNVNNTEFYAMTAEEWSKQQNKYNYELRITNYESIKNDKLSIVVDPPRSGLTKDVIKFLLESNAGKIVYVSCNPSTLARDLAAIAESGLYTIKEITPVDMFPQTYHIETVVLLEKNNT
ncbi:MAG: 23S rRNA (uracil(1939)-C(5))-methyltransferase RlmD [Endomicrobia bacterium]|nr:23S rRNA (uracil(1939)-C(5))-methyltransferase RlmD [Endomicrobiia bacterium]MCL2507372.1 23S rRNA (uracil(1939)-C(5))-methyltransferase RlmD [Endomicrobiia bacterium]